jgi:hypothetical protein
MPLPTTTLPAAGVSPRSTPTSIGTIPSGEKRVSKKKRISAKWGEGAIRVLGGYPAVAEIADEAAYEWQRSFVYGWFNEMLEKLKGDCVNAAGNARAALEPLYLEFTALLEFAEAGRDEATKQWAGALLANIFKRIEKHDKKLCAVNAAYRVEKAKVARLRTDVLFPGRITLLVQQELFTALEKRRRLLMKREVVKKQSGRKWRKKSRKVIEEAADALPEEYLPTLKLPQFSVKSEPRWWKFLWPLLTKKIDRLKGKALAQRDTKSGGIKARKRYAADCQKTARKHLKLLARLKDERSLFLLRAASS